LGIEEGTIENFLNTGGFNHVKEINGESLEDFCIDNRGLEREVFPFFQSSTQQSISGNRLLHDLIH
jgi:hypothetical protein